jgi:hypothetical protein
MELFNGEVLHRVRSVSETTSAVLLFLLAAAVAAASLMLPRIRQPQTYHLFADRRSLLGVPNFCDVVSNVPFALVGICGLLWLFGPDSDEHFVDSRERWPYAFVFLGLLLTAFGSSYYHLSPDNARLVWDRLPMTVTFMAMVAAVIAERISVNAGLRLLPLLLLVGMGSVLQWYGSEVSGAGDLRFYAAVQAGSALVLLLALIFPKRYTRSSDLAVVVGFYALAKVLESLDKPIFAEGQIVSGHTLKHLAAAAAGYWILRMLQKRRALVAQSGSKPLGCRSAVV